MLIHKATVRTASGSPLSDQVEDKLQGDDGERKKGLISLLFLCRREPGLRMEFVTNTTGALEINKIYFHTAATEHEPVHRPLYSVIPC